MGTNYPEALKFTFEDLLNTSYKDLVKRKGVGNKAIELRYEALRKIAKEYSSYWTIDQSKE